MPISMLGIYLLLFVCLSVSLSAGLLVTDILGVGWRRAMKFCRMVHLGGYQVISPFGELWPRGKPPRSKIEKSITRRTVVSLGWQTWLDSRGLCVVWETGCRLLSDGQCCKLFAAIGMWDIRQSGQLTYLFIVCSHSTLAVELQWNCKTRCVWLVAGRCKCAPSCVFSRSTSTVRPHATCLVSAGIEWCHSKIFTFCCFVWHICRVHVLNITQPSSVSWHVRCTLMNSVQVLITDVRLTEFFSDLVLVSLKWIFLCVI